MGLCALYSIPIVVLCSREIRRFDEKLYMCVCVCVTCVSEQLAAIIRSTMGRAAAARRYRWRRRRRGVPRPPNWNIRRCWTSTIRNKTPIRLENRSRARWVRHWPIVRHCGCVPAAVYTLQPGSKLNFWFFAPHQYYIHNNIKYNDI